VLLPAIGTALSFSADVIGSASRNPEAAMQWLLPHMILGLLSVGVQPAELFPQWIQPIVRNQPTSQWVYALRALAGDLTSP
jgi:ABC-2 type transport system permease protein